MGLPDTVGGMAKRSVCGSPATSAFWETVMAGWRKGSIVRGPGACGVLRPPAHTVLPSAVAMQPFEWTGARCISLL